MPSSVQEESTPFRPLEINWVSSADSTTSPRPQQRDDISTGTWKGRHRQVHVIQSQIQDRQGNIQSKIHPGQTNTLNCWRLSWRTWQENGKTINPLKNSTRGGSSDFGPWGYWQVVRVGMECMSRDVVMGGHTGIDTRHRLLKDPNVFPQCSFARARMLHAREL